MLNKQLFHPHLQVRKPVSPDRGRLPGGSEERRTWIFWRLGVSPPPSRRSCFRKCFRKCFCCAWRWRRLWGHRVIGATQQLFFLLCVSCHNMYVSRRLMKRRLPWQRHFKASWAWSEGELSSVPRWGSMESFPASQGRMRGMEGWRNQTELWESSPGRTHQLLLETEHPDPAGVPQIHRSRLSVTVDGGISCQMLLFLF